MTNLDLTLDINKNQEQPTLILCNRELKKLGAISSYSGLTTPVSFNDVNNISFSVNRENCVLFDSIIDFKLIYVKELNSYYEIQVSFTSSTLDEKTITGTYLSNAELSQIMLYGIEINTEADIAREDYVNPTTIYDPLHPEDSLLDRILEKAPHYTIKYVDTTLRGLIRTFTIDGTSIDDFLRTTLAQEIDCLVDYDSYDRSISLYDLESNCLELDCLYRGNFTGVCPVCGSTYIKEGYGENTSVFLSKDNLIESVTLEGDKDSVKNCFRIVGGDDLMTATVTNYNPNGSNYIYLFSDETKADMPVALVDKLDDYDVLYSSYKTEYASLMEDIYENIDQSLYLTSGMQPTIPAITTTAILELNKLTTANIGQIGVGDLSYASLATVNNAVLGVAEIYMTQGYKVEIVSSSIVSTTWSGKFKVTNIADDTDTATNSVNILLTLTQDLLTFTQQKIDKMLKKKTVTDEITEIVAGYYYNLNFYKEATHTTLITGEAGSLYVDMTSGVTTNCSYLWDGTKYDTFWNRYCLNRLVSFESSFQSCLDIIIEKAGTSLESNNVLYPMYLEYRRVIIDIDREAKIREGEIAVVDTEMEALTARQMEIQSDLDLEAYLGNSLWLVFSSYRREDTYQNDNYISEGLNTVELFDKAEELFKVASEEIIKASKLQLSLTGTFKNLLAMEEFEPVWDKFKLGNWIRVEVDDDLYKLRLISVDNNYEDPSNTTITFSDVTKTRNGVTDVKSILDKATSVASSYSSTIQQASQGKDANDVLTDFRTDGLNSALYKIKNADTQDVVFDEHGITCRSYDDTIQDYLPEQLKIVNNVLAFTDDNWATVKSALGKMNYTIDGVSGEGYGLNSQFVLTGLIQGGDIYSSNYSSTVGALAGTHINLNTGNFTFAGGKLKYDGTTLNIDGTINATTGNIGGWNLTSNSIYRGNANWGNVSGMYFGVNGLSISNVFKVNSAGQMSATGATISGNITATTLTATNNGTISVWNIDSESINRGAIDYGNPNGMYFGLLGLSISNKFKVDTLGNVTANSFNSSSANITGGTFKVNTSSADFSTISLSYSQFSSIYSPLETKYTNTTTNKRMVVQAGGIFFADYIEGVTNVTRGNLGAGYFQIFNSSGNLKTAISDGSLRMYDDYTIMRAEYDGTHVRYYNPAGALMSSYDESNAYVINNVSAASFTDRTPHYEGDALTELRTVSGSTETGIDHETLPEFARAKIKKDKLVTSSELLTPSNINVSSTQKELGLKSFKKSSKRLKSSKALVKEEEDGRDIGAMVSVLTKAIQQLLDKNDEQDKEIAELKSLLEKSSKK